MGWAFWTVAGVLLVMAVVAAGLATLLRAERRRGRRELGSLRSECDDLRSRVDQLARPTRPPGEEAPDYVITRVGDAALVTGTDEDARGRRISDRLVLSAAFGEPLVTVLAFGHGVRRALSAESRNRIGFEMRREMRRSRKVRRREMRAAWKQMRANDREDVA